MILYGIPRLVYSLGTLHNSSFDYGGADMCISGCLRRAVHGNSDCFRVWLVQVGIYEENSCWCQGQGYPGYWNGRPRALRINLGATA